MSCGCKHCAETKRDTENRGTAAKTTRPDAAPDIRSAGNMETQSWLRSQGIQASLTVSSPGDAYEREADRVADQVVSGGAPPEIHRMCASCEEEVHREADGSGTSVSSHAERQIGAVGTGQPLSSSTRAFFEPRFGRSLEQVRIHTDNQAATAARSINARAYTKGNDIVFGAGEYQPGSAQGRHLLAHEITHTIQQTGKGNSSSVQRTIGDGHDLTSPRFAGDAVLEACFDNERVLTVGDKGTPVATIQHALIEAGISLPKFGVDGDFGSETKQGVKDFQAAQGLTGKDVDGVIGPKTMGLFDARFPTAPAPGAAPISGTPPPSGKAPTLSATVTTPASPPGNCGGVLYILRWDLSANAGALGGFVIQDVSFNWTVNDCAGAPVPNPDPRTSPLRYFEAWRVAPNSTSLSPETTDRFFWPDAAPWGGACTNGTVSIVATARFHNNVRALPAHMQPFNNSTFANNLPSSTSDPNLGGDTSNSMSHVLRFHWTCCPCSTTPTVIDQQTP